MVLQADYDKIELKKKLVMTLFQWRCHHYVTKKRHQKKSQKFSNLAPLPMKNFWPRQPRLPW